MSEERRVLEVLARYVRASDKRDGKAQAALFTDDAVTEIRVKTGPDEYEAGEPLIGGAGVAYTTEHRIAPLPAGRSTHHMTADHIVEVNGDRAHLSAQFVVFEVQAAARPAGGWPATAVGAQATIHPIESGYYDTDLRLVDGEWKISGNRVLMDMPFVLPEA